MVNLVTIGLSTALHALMAPGLDIPSCSPEETSKPDLRSAHRALLKGRMAMKSGGEGPIAGWNLFCSAHRLAGDEVTHQLEHLEALASAARDLPNDDELRFERVELTSRALAKFLERHSTDGQLAPQEQAALVIARTELEALLVALRPAPTPENPPPVHVKPPDTNEGVQKASPGSGTPTEDRRPLEIDPLRKAVFAAGLATSVFGVGAVAFSAVAVREANRVDTEVDSLQLDVMQGAEVCALGDVAAGAEEVCRSLNGLKTGAIVSWAFFGAAAISTAVLGGLLVKKKRSGRTSRLRAEPHFAVGWYDVAVGATLRF